MPLSSPTPAQNRGASASFKLNAPLPASVSACPNPPPTPIRGPRLCCGVRLQVHRDVSRFAAQRGRALRRRGTPTAPAPPRQHCPRATCAPPPGQPRTARSSLPGTPDGPQCPPPGAQGPVQVLPQPGGAVRPSSLLKWLDTEVPSGLHQCHQRGKSRPSWSLCHGPHRRPGQLPEPEPW